MSMLIRWMMPLVAYLCVGTVVSGALGYWYLRQSGRLDDETLFRITALVQGVDLEALAKESHATVNETPPDEPSFDEQQQKLHAATLHFDAKQKQLADSLSDFDYQLKRVSEATERFAALRSIVEKYLRDERQKVVDASLSSVRAQLEALDPKKQAKPLLIKYIAGGDIDTVIMLLGSMKDKTRREILRTFDVVPDDINMLFQIQDRMLNDNPAKPLIDAQLEALKQLNSQEN